MKIQICKICGHRNDQTVLYPVKEMMYGKRDIFNYFQCANCECLQICEFPVNISAYYPSNYYSFSSYRGKKFKGIAGYFNQMKYRASVVPENFIDNLLHSFFPVSKFDFFEGLEINLNSRILEVGCGNGNRLLYPLAVLGFKNILGCDPYISDSINYSNGLTILKSDVFKIEHKCDLIIYDHAFEHVDNPQENLIKVSALLNSGGVCVLRIPTVPCYAWSHYGTNWVQIDAPRHFFLHSPQSIALLATKAGLRLANIQYDSTHFQFSGSEKYLADIPLVTIRNKGILAFVKRRIKKFEYEKLALKLNREKKGDQAIYYIRKD